VDRYVDHRRKYFDPHWREMDFSILYPKTEKAVPQPENLADMLRVAAELSKHFGFVDVIFESTGGIVLDDEMPTLIPRETKKKK
jgi:hypothetical protein